jgi:colanic acid/amylovoran biosynthesis glycosyltransferase
MTRVAYLVSRFPLTTETFVVRELDRVARLDGMDVELLSLFPAGDQVVHEEARRWVGEARRASPLRGAFAFARELLRAPRTVARIVARVVTDHAAEPRVLAKALTTTVLACDHAATVRRRGVDHVHAHFATYPALAAWAIGELTGVSYSVTPHAHDIFVSQRGLRTRLGGAAAVVAVSDYHWRYLQHFGAAPARLHRHSYGLDLTRYAFAPRALPDDGPVDVLCVSSFREYKGQRVLLDALALGGPALQRLRIAFVGAGPLLEDCRAQAVALGLQDRCTFAGAQDQIYLRSRLAEAHVLVQPSLVQADGDTEGLPNTLIEAAACGVTMVGTRVAGVQELVQDGVTGFLADPASPEDLHRALVAVLAAQEGDAEAMRRAARARVESHHDLDALATALAAVFRSAARAPGARSAPPAPPR